MSVEFVSSRNSISAAATKPPSLETVNPRTAVYGTAIPWVASVCVIVRVAAVNVRPFNPIDTRYDPSGRPATVEVPSVADVAERPEPNHACVRVMVAPGAEVSAAPDEP